MKTNFFRMFPTTASITESFLTDKEVQILLQKMKDVDFMDHTLISGDAESSHITDFDKKQHILNSIKDTNLYNKIMQKLDEYTSSMGLFDVFITNSWFNIQYPNSQLGIHNHPTSKVSAALYLKVDEKSSNLIFHDAHPFADFRERTEDNEFNFNMYSIKPSVGMLVLFPSWLKHSGSVNQSKERIIISFNTDTKR